MGAENQILSLASFPFSSQYLSTVVQGRNSGRLATGSWAEAENEVKELK